jgi:hypothetical protein
LFIALAMTWSMNGSAFRTYGVAASEWRVQPILAAFAAFDIIKLVQAVRRIISIFSLAKTSTETSHA